MVRNRRVLYFNRARRQDEWRQAEDALGNLLSVELPDSTLLEYVIDGQNRRIGEKVGGVIP